MQEIMLTLAGFGLVLYAIKAFFEILEAIFK